MNLLDRLIRYLNQFLMIVAGMALLGIIGLTVGNIWSRLFWAPIKGSVELIGLLGAIAAAFALSFTQTKNAHIAVDLLILKFPKKIQKTLSAVNALLGAAFFSIAGVQLIRWGTTLWITGELTETLRIIYHPFVYAVALGCFVMALALLAEVLKTVCAGPKGK
jgi:TRAP-type C4-dicarboxylate transport system permease small subunit